QFVDVAELENLGDVKNGFRSLAAQVIRILYGKNGARVQEAAAEKYDAVVRGGGVVNGLGIGVGHQELQAIGEFFFRANLERVVDGVRNWRRVALEVCILRVRQQELELRNHWRGEAAGEITNIVRWITGLAWVRRRVEKERIRNQIGEIPNLGWRQACNGLGNDVLVAETA